MKNQVVLITGGSRGIGRGIAQRFAQEGTVLVLNCRKEPTQEIVQELKDLGANDVKIILADIQHYEEAEKVIEQVIESYGRIDVLVNSAGITKDTLLLRMSPEDFDQVINVNLKGTFNTIKAASKYMIKQRFGRILNLSSVVGLVGNAGQANYAASKAGVVGLTKSVARELASRGITCNAIAPGFIETDMTDQLSEKVKEASKNQIPLKSFGQVEDVAKAAYFLATSPYVTGQVLNIDGGMVMNG